MKFIALKTYKMPALGFGTYQLTGDNCAQAVAAAIGTGYRHIDTAQIYDNEDGVGRGVKLSGVSRGDLFLTTKLWRKAFAEDAVVRAVDRSLENLGTEYVDLLLVHWPFPETSVAKLVEGVMQAQEAGKARLIGVSNFTAAQVEEAAHVSGGAVCVDQVEYHPYLSQRPVLAAVRKHDMALTAYSPVARGKAANDPALKEIGLKYGKSAGQVALRWLMQQDRVAAIPKAGTPANIKSNFEIFDFELSADDMEKIHGLARADGRQVDPDFAPAWDRAA